MSTAPAPIYRVTRCSVFGQYNIAPLPGHQGDTCIPAAMAAHCAYMYLENTIVYIQLIRYFMYVHDVSTNIEPVLEQSHRTGCFSAELLLLDRTKKKSWHHSHNPPQPQKLELSSSSSTPTTSALETLSTHHSHFTALNPQSWPPLLTQSLRTFSRYEIPCPPHTIPHLPLPPATLISLTLLLFVITASARTCCREQKLGCSRAPP